MRKGFSLGISFNINEFIVPFATFFKETLFARERKLNFQVCFSLKNSRGSSHFLFEFMEKYFSCFYSQFFTEFSCKIPWKVCFNWKCKLSLAFAHDRENEKSLNNLSNFIAIYFIDVYTQKMCLFQQIGANWSKKHVFLYFFSINV